ncbi:MAG: hypothetical protein KF901_33170 [Myxococcales bacterium]|nr:hypothetical protein [Myxococcales bacterium]
MRTGERYFGVYLGTVLDADDPDGLGRVRLETDQYTDTEDDPTWAAVTRPLAGDVFSVFFTPKVGDQVVFSFLAGDVRQPIVLGYAHTDEKKPADVSETKHAIVIKDVGSITFDEANGGSITIAHARGGSIVLERDHVSIEASSVCVNGEGVVLVPFIDQVFRTHQHSVAEAATVALTQPTPGPLPPRVKTDCRP